MMFNARSLTKVAAISSLIVGTVASSAMAVPLCQSMTQKSQGKTLVSQSVDEDSNLKFEFRGCYRTKSTTVTCDVLVTNLGTTRPKILFGAVDTYKPLTNAIDTSGTVYATYEVIAGGSSNKYYVNINFAPSIPTKVSFVFEIPAQVTELTALDVGFGLWDGPSSTAPKQITLTNIGAIAPKANSASTNRGNNSNCTCPPNSTSPRRRPK
ncbi:MAG: hypothetical protein RMZ41_014740 [Nostoc sp. DedVER02]|uniref:hypothetical protein n=1 Tax=unclassified Nostoc TaxID=2593658 RepID=UPI002AD4BC8E|nr:MULTISPECIES: hypothetical protein [unclassified Nostoc]MDZ7989270.1 hypothetical protein [Nostoc sp. DedVER02]MDZ8114350.1 hypothetical protein [Nostoc sp. DedVER01b]